MTPGMVRNRKEIAQALHSYEMFVQVAMFSGGSDQVTSHPSRIEASVAKIFSTVKANYSLLMAYTGCKIYSSAVQAVDLPTLSKVQNSLSPIVHGVANLVEAGGEFVQQTLPLYAFACIGLLSMLFLRGKALVVAGIFITVLAEIVQFYIRRELSSSLLFSETGRWLSKPTASTLLLGGLGASVEWITVSAVGALTYGALRKWISHKQPANINECQTTQRSEPINGAKT